MGRQGPREQQALMPSSSPVCSSQEDSRAAQQRLHKQLAEHLRQSWGPLGASTQVRDLGEMLQAWDARTTTSTPKGSRFTHSEKFTFHLVGSPEWTGSVPMAALRVAFCINTTVFHTASPCPLSRPSNWETVPRGLP